MNDDALASKLQMRKCAILHFFSLQRFHTEGAKIEAVDGFTMVTKMAANVEIMMQHKIDAIKVNIVIHVLTRRVD